MNVPHLTATHLRADSSHDPSLTVTHAGEAPSFDVALQAEQSYTSSHSPSLGERQNKAVSHLLSQVADLLGNVRDGIRRNLVADEPAKSNHRLLVTAVGVVGDMVQATRVAGRRIVSGPASFGSSPIDVYAKVASTTSQPPSDFVLAAKSLVREVDRSLKTLSVSTADDAGRAFSLLDGLEARLRHLDPSTAGFVVPVKLDRVA